MWELEREDLPALARLRCAVVGDGRLGRAIAAGLHEAGLSVDGPLGRGARCPNADVVILAVPDAEIANAAAAVDPREDGPRPEITRRGGTGPLVGHCSGATTLDPLAPHEAFSLHPLMTVPADGPAQLAGASAAIAGSTPHARGVAHQLALHLGLTPIDVADEDRAAYHAAASIASNFLITLEAAAERLAADAGIDRTALVPLVRATVENWASMGAERALTGPIARGDTETVERQRHAIAERAPELLPLYDALAEATRSLATQGHAAAEGIERGAAPMAEVTEAGNADRAGGSEDARAAAARRTCAHPELTGPARSSTGALA
jgi:predicted short-subunit dehydrogenase-like oxidoreductase (DUF2520 family)